MVVYIFPGQGSQKVGMGKGLFEQFPELTAKADEILGYSIADLCLSDPQGNLSKTQFTQPALFVVNALAYHQKGGQKPNYLAGHSLGEYSALYAANSFTFETGLRLVQKRGELMSQATGSGMAAVIGKSGEEIEKILNDAQLNTIDIANYNTPKQIVISGPKEAISEAQTPLKEAGCRYIPLNVSGPFHSRYMTPSRDAFETFIEQFQLNPPEIPVISNYTARPYGADEVKTNLVEQINHSVRWVESIQYLLEQGEEEFVEIGPGKVLTGLVSKIKPRNSF